MGLTVGSRPNMGHIGAGAPHFEPKRARALGWGFGTIAYGVLLFIVSGLPDVRALERAAGGATFGLDKVLHAGTFLVLGVMIAKSLGSLRGSWDTRWGLAGVFGVGGTYALFHEGVQLFLPAFAFNPADLAADFVGLGLAYIISAIGAHHSKRTLSGGGSRGSTGPSSPGGGAR